MWKRIYLLSFVVLLFFFVGCSKVENETFSPYPYSDEDYLEVDRLSNLPYDQDSYADIEQYLKDFTTMLINQSFFCNGAIPNELLAYISKDDFKKLCISYDKKDDCFSACQICNIEANHNFKKAVVGTNCKSLIRKYDVYNVYGEVSGGEFNIKVYYIYINEKWIVENVVNSP